jgi:fluoroquinolone resistance protein
MLNLSSFHKLKLKNTRFSKCALQEVDFAETNLTGATFDGCDLSRAVFDRTTLDAADFRLASNYIIDPEKNSIRKARFAQDGLIGLLQRYDIRVG